MNITVVNGINSVKLVYNDLATQNIPNIFSKERVIKKSAVMQLKLALEEAYVEIVYVDGSKEQFTSDVFEDYASNKLLFDGLASFIM
jgi:hypothetical protein